MATDPELEAAWTDARLALLERLKTSARSDAAGDINELAEAYAWLTSPQQPD
jgi:hypothetical protein